MQKFCVAAPGREQRPEPIISAFAEIKNIGIFKCRQFIVRTDRLAGITLSPVIMSHSVMISTAHLDSLTQEAFCDSLGNRNHSYSADSTTSGVQPPSLPQKKGEKNPAQEVPSSQLCSSTRLSAFLLLTPTPRQPEPHFTPDYRASTANLPLSHTPPSHQPPAWADCQCLRVIRGRFSFIILSKSGTALALGGLG